MTQPNFNEMSREDLRAYVLEHRDDEAAFHAYMDCLANVSILVGGKPEDARDPVRFAAIMEKARRIKQGLEPPEG